MAEGDERVVTLMHGYGPGVIRDRGKGPSALSLSLPGGLCRSSNQTDALCVDAMTMLDTSVIDQHESDDQSSTMPLQPDKRSCPPCAANGGYPRCMITPDLRTPMTQRGVPSAHPLNDSSAKRSIYSGPSLRQLTYKESSRRTSHPGRLHQVRNQGLTGPIGPPGRSFELHCPAL